MILLSFLSISFIGICCLWFSLALKLEENGSGWRCSSGNDKQVIFRPLSYNLS